MAENLQLHLQPRAKNDWAQLPEPPKNAVWDALEELFWRLAKLERLQDRVAAVNDWVNRGEQLRGGRVKLSSYPASPAQKAAFAIDFTTVEIPVRLEAQRYTVLSWSALARGEVGAASAS